MVTYIKKHNWASFKNQIIIKLDRKNEAIIENIFIMHLSNTPSVLNYKQKILIFFVPNYKQKRQTFIIVSKKNMFFKEKLNAKCIQFVLFFIFSITNNQ